MKRNMRLLSLLLAVVIVIGMVPFSALATDSAETAVCEHCGVELTEGARHSVACPTYCTCDPKPAEGQAHSTLCPLNLLSKLSAVADYVEEQAAGTTTEAPTTESTTAPATEPGTDPTTAPATEPTTAPTTEPTTEPTTAPTTEPTTEPTTAPTTEPATEPSTEATEPSTEATEPTAPEVTGPQVGDKIWIKSGSKVYIDYTQGESFFNAHDVLFNYEVVIKSIITDENGAPVWYEYDGSGTLLAAWKYVKAENTTTQNPDAEDVTEVKEKIVEKMDSFVEIVEEMPEADAVETFDNAITDFAEIHALAEKDSALPNVEVEQYETAYLTFAEAMGYNSADVTVTYPNPELEVELKNSVIEALTLYQDAEELYASLPASEVSTFSNAEETQSKSVVNLDESYAAAKEKLDAIVEVKPDLLENDTALMAMDLGNGVSTVDAVAENIQMNLFNYGPLINTQQSGQGRMPFIHSEGTYGWAVDSTGNNPPGSAGGWPKLQTTLTDARKFPHILEDKGTIKAGSMQYLFDPAYTTGRVSYDTYKANISSMNTSGPNPYEYHSIYFPVSNNDGSGTGLFQKEGNYFVYDSGKNAAWYNPNTQKFELYNYVVRPAYTTFSTAGTNGNFLPFNQGHTQGREDYQTATYVKEYTYNNGSETVNATATIAKPDTVSTKPTGALTAYRLNGNSRNSEVDLWFGMNLEFDFNQPKGGIKGNDAMVFEFLGDDDVFVYIDNVLILDIGGTHGAQTGKINFATGAVTNPASYGQYAESSTLYALMKAALGNDLDETQFIDSNGDGTKDTFKDFTTHNLKFYYLERGGNISYCRLKFNMDPLPTGNVTLQKVVEGINEAIDDDQSYEFEVTATDANGAAVNGMTYKVISGDTTSDQKTVDNGGKVTLKANEIATFTNLTAGTVIVFKEVDNAQTSRLIWMLNGVVQNGNSATTTVAENTTQMARFVCTNTRKTTSLTIEKQMAGDEYVTDDQYEMMVTIGNKPYTGTAIKTAADGTTTSQVTFDTNGKTNLLADEKIIITGIPTGLTYSVVETMPENDMTYRYDAPAYQVNGIEVDEVSGNINSETTVIVTNTLHLLFGDLTITKVVDKENPDQSFRFYVTGGPEDAPFSGYVIIPASAFNGGTEASITIENLRVGDYVVSEDTAWSWRYTCVSEKSFNIDLTPSGETVIFRNQRTDNQWLDGEHSAINVFEGVSAPTA